MTTYTITVTEAQAKALDTIAISVEDWIQNFVNVRATQEIDAIVKNEIEKKLANGESISGTKDEIVLSADIETAAEKQLRFDVEKLL
jgi:hypothetical protein